MIYNIFINLNIKIYNQMLHKIWLNFIQNSKTEKTEVKEEDVKKPALKVCIYF